MSSVPKAQRHGQARIRTPEYRTWTDMRHRCLNPKHKNFHRWGGRGITVCPEWESFAQFFTDMGARPAGMTLERVDNDGGYGPNNCIWAPRAVQHRNTRQTRRVTINGDTRCLKDWATEYNIQYTTVQGRVYRRGWSPIDALTTPVDPGWRINNLRGSP